MHTNFKYYTRQHAGVSLADDIDVHLLATAEFADGEIASDIVVSVTYALVGGDAVNYYLTTDTDQTTASITKRQVTIKIPGQSSALGADIVVKSEVVSGSILVGDMAYSLTTDADKDVLGSYEIFGENTDTEHYEISFIYDGMYTVVEPEPEKRDGIWLLVALGGGVAIAIIAGIVGLVKNKKPKNKTSTAKPSLKTA